MKKPILSVKNLEISFSQYTKALKRKNIRVINDLNIDLYEGEILAVVGSSGSGKSLLAHAILDILPENASISGEIIYKDEILDSKKIESLRKTDISFVPQSVNYLDPLMKVSSQVKIAVEDKAKKNILQRKIFDKYNLDEEVDDYYPHQLSGGMARKVLLANALVKKCSVLILDEPTPGLDEISLNEVLKDLEEVKKSNCAVLMITHDIEAALKIADKIAVFYAGTTLEVADINDFTDEDKLRHPYSKALYRSLPQNSFEPIKGSQPLTSENIDGCLFYDRCDLRDDKCSKKIPDVRNLRDGMVRCIHAT